MKLNAIVLSGYGINCEYETANAVRQVGGNADIVHFNDLIRDKKMLENYNLFILPGGFAFGDDLGSGQVLANKIKSEFLDDISDFFNDGKLILGICNGFQVLSKLGALPYFDFRQKITLIQNNSAKFEDRWVYLKVNQNSPSVFLKGLSFAHLPIRHGEGKFVFADNNIKMDVLSNNLFAMQYVNESGELAGYPYNPNGSDHNIAAINDKTGRILGMMPHPEAYPTLYHSPQWTFKMEQFTGLEIFKNAEKYVEQNL